MRRDILPAGVEALRLLGAPLAALCGFPFHGIRFLENGASIEARFAAGHGIGVRKVRLHQLLTQRAESIGVRVHWGVNAPELAELAESRWNRGADGQSSRIRSLSRLDRGVERYPGASAFAAIIESRRGAKWWRSTGARVASSS